ncbi:MULTISPECIES: 3-hydroxyacyl-CoA dehydrogenase family protein [Neobacillus]|uniref:3-hydroxyacyl-CoA dehydrogenase family protein n=1 Tax=Neobacillus rhizophilus TaxID=2833579 RepID=A0A942U5J5_9BACI|nr:MULTISPECIES: 3-hydroxyacyl-CoA dehydrogenase family protein [Neobacillus]MBS4215125.1 3-hydroxyacyl-CoA dehydrogenase family protein [Neobacillus rhizophilus]
MNKLKVCVVGAGTMGRGIAQVFAEANFDVLLIDKSKEQLTIAFQYIRKYLSFNYNNTEIEQIIARISTSEQIDSQIAEYSLIVEAVPENLELKKRIFSEIEPLVPEDTILATNTSQISVTSIASACENTCRVLGMHFSNPPHRMELVEIIRGLKTDENTVDMVVDITKQIGKKPYVVNDVQGFVVSRIAAAVISEGIRILEEGVCDKETLDGIVKTGLNHPMGPLELVDHIGLDIFLMLSSDMFEAYGDRFRASRTLKQYVEAGMLGKKTGEGFYKYA